MIIPLVIWTEFSESDYFLYLRRLGLFRIGMRLLRGVAYFGDILIGKT
jgi:hypothetical protein